MLPTIHYVFCLCLPFFLPSIHLFVIRKLYKYFLKELFGMYIEHIFMIQIHTVVPSRLYIYNCDWGIILSVLYLKALVALLLLCKTLFFSSQLAIKESPTLSDFQSIVKELELDFLFFSSIIPQETCMRLSRTFRKFLFVTIDQSKAFSAVFHCELTDIGKSV